MTSPAFVAICGDLNSSRGPNDKNSSCGIHWKQQASCGIPALLLDLRYALVHLASSDNTLDGQLGLTQTHTGLVWIDPRLLKLDRASSWWAFLGADVGCRVDVAQ